MGRTYQPSELYMTAYGSITKLMQEVEDERIEQLRLWLTSRGVIGFLQEVKIDTSRLTSREAARLVHHTRALLRTRLEGLKNQASEVAHARVLSVGWSGKPRQ